MKTTLQLLRDGRAFVEAGWVKGSAMTHDADGHEFVCALGGILRANDVHTDLNYHAAERCLHDEMPRGFLHVPGYNDDPCTTRADILALYDRAIAKLEPPPLVLVSVTELIAELEQQEAVAA